MRYLAIARYRILIAVRGGSWLFVLLIAAAAVLVERTELLYERSVFLSHPDSQIPMSAGLLVLSYFLHIFVLLGACASFGAVKKGAQNAGDSDLIETAPILPRHRFVGDAIGIFLAVMLLHFCAVPLLALHVSLSPYSSRLFVVAELVIIALVLFVSASSSWRLRAQTFRNSYARGFRSQALFITLFILVIRLNVRSFEDFLNAAVWVIAMPSPDALSRVADTLNDPVLFFTSLAVLFGGFLCFFYFHAVRSLQTR